MYGFTVSVSQALWLQTSLYYHSFAVSHKSREIQLGPFRLLRVESWHQPDSLPYPMLPERICFLAHSGCWLKLESWGPIALLAVSWEGGGAVFPLETLNISSHAFSNAPFSTCASSTLKHWVSLTSPASLTPARSSLLVQVHVVRWDHPDHPGFTILSWITLILSVKSLVSCDITYL